MSVSCFTSTNSHLCKFLRTTGRDWRNTIYIECGDCQRAVSRGCKNLLCAFDTAGAPVIVPVHDVEYLFSTTVDKSECRAILTKVNGHQPGGISALCFDFLRDGKQRQNKEPLICGFVLAKAFHYYNTITY